MLQDHAVQYHIAARPGEIGGYCLLPGDPARCEKIAAYLEDPYPLCERREFKLWCGTLAGELVTVCSTGIGGPSTAIAVEELAACGAHTMIRIGTCGGIALDVQAGDLVVANGAVRQDGTSREYAPIEFPAVPHPDVLFALCRAASESGPRFHIGTVQSKDSFYGQHSPHRMPVERELLAKWEAWKRLGVLASEMEAATLFTVGAARNLRTGAVFLSVWNQERVNEGLDSGDAEVHDTDSAIRCAIGALRLLIAEDVKKRNGNP
ncbi:MAG: uridine phosphorylase [Clostridia bacterium]|nr:uridine phosphorylase [Clostridia bacterium]